MGNEAETVTVDVVGYDSRGKEIKYAQCGGCSRYVHPGEQIVWVPRADLAQDGWRCVHRRAKTR